MDFQKYEGLLKQRYRRLAEFSPVGIFHTDVEGQCVYVNDRWSEITGLNPADALGDGWARALHPDDRQRVIDEWNDAARENRSFNSEYRFQRPDGETTWVLGQARAESDESGTLNGYVGAITDITERKRMEAALRDSEHQLAQAQRIAMLGNWQWDIATNEVVWSDAMYRIFGLSRGAISPSFEEFITRIHPEDVPSVVQHIERVRQRGENQEFDHRIILPDDSTRILHSEITLVKDAAGSTTRWFGTAQDITERRKVETKFQENEAKYRRLTESTNAILWELDLSTWRFTYVAPQAEQLLGYPIEMWCEKDFWPDHLHPDDREAALRFCRSSTERLEDHEFEYRMIASDGRIVWIHDLVTVISGVDVAEQLRGVMIDITERKQAEVSLRESEERYLSLSEASFEGLLIHDNGRIIDTNTRFLGMFGYSLEELIKTNAFDLIAPNDREEVKRNVAEEKEGPFEAAGLRKDSTTFPMEFQVRHMHYRGEHVRVVACQDITNRKRVERFQSDQAHVLELISQGTASQTEILEAIVNVAEEHSPNMRSTILLLDGKTLRHGAALSMPGGYNAQIDGMLIGPAAGSCGTAAYRKSRVIVENVQTDPLWANYRVLGEEFGFRACWSQPILDIRDNVLGTFALYSENPGMPTDREIQIIESMAHLAGIAIERTKAEAALRVRAETERLLRQELNHRVRNILASLVSLIDLSRSGTKSATVLAESIKGRIQSIASVHSVLSQAEWRAIGLRTLMRTITDPHSDSHITLDGPDVVVPPEQAQAIGLVVHELLINSDKHGALCNPNGCVEVAWETHRDQSDRLQLLIHWVETGGPPIVAQPKPGTGMNLIDGLVQSELHGHIEFGFPNQGADHTIAMTLQDTKALDTRAVSAGG